jgi:hypothetical protein
MATTVKESFKQFATNLNITDRQETVVSNCRKNVVEKIGNKISLHPDQSSKLIGSYDRDTIIRYLKDGDVDVMMVLHYGNNKDWDTDDGAAKALNRFKEILKDAYPDTECNVDRNCVTMKLSQFRLDVVPAFKFNDGSYTIPDTHRGKWLKTNPVKFADEVTRINKNMNSIFVPLVKMLKGWNKTLSKPLRGFHLECMLINHYKNYTQDYSYESTLNVFFSKLPSYLSAASYDPISGDQVDLYLDNKSLGYNREDFVKRATKAAALAKEAHEDCEKYPSVAIGEWKDLLGEFFPAYG